MSAHPSRFVTPWGAPPPRSSHLPAVFTLAYGRVRRQSNFLVAFGAILALSQGRRMRFSEFLEAAARADVV
eukprot:9472363-Pyramimonas_sp.AAC.1